MGDPFVALLIGAAAKGFISLKDYDGSRRWWVGARIGMLHFKQGIQSDIAKERIRLAGTDLETVEAIAAYENSLLPQEKTSDSDLDLIANYYLTTHPHLIPK